MAFLDKLMFWKKKEEPFGADLGLGRDIGLGGRDIGLGHDLGLGKEDLGLPPQTQFPPQQPMPFQQPYQYPQYQQPSPMIPTPPSPQQEIVGKDIEIISSKIDALRATLESINQRLANLERVAYSEEKRRRW